MDDMAGKTPGYVWTDKGGWRIAHEARAIIKGKNTGMIRATLSLGKKVVVNKIYPLCDDTSDTS